jgi:hypothetical protein
LETFLHKPRNTQSARAINAKRATQVQSTLAASRLQSPSGGSLAPAPTGAEQLGAVLLGLHSQKQDAVRILAYHRLVLEAKMAAMLHRMEEGGLEWGAEDGDMDMGVGESDALQRLKTAVDDNQEELVRAVGRDVTRAILRAIWAPDMQDALKLSVMSEDEARDLSASNHEELVARERVLAGELEEGAKAGGSIAIRGARNEQEARERAARLWRRRLWKITIPVRIDAKLRWATAHDDVDHKGNRSLVNELNRKDPEEAFSYCELLPPHPFTPAWVK